MKNQRQNPFIDELDTKISIGSEITVVVALQNRVFLQAR